MAHRVKLSVPLSHLWDNVRCDGLFSKGILFLDVSILKETMCACPFSCLKITSGRFWLCALGIEVAVSHLLGTIMFVLGFSCSLVFHCWLLYQLTHKGEFSSSGSPTVDTQGICFTYSNGGESNSSAYVCICVLQYTCTCDFSHGCHLKRLCIFRHEDLFLI